MPFVFRFFVLIFLGVGNLSIATCPDEVVGTPTEPGVVTTVTDGRMDEVDRGAGGSDLGGGSANGDFSAGSTDF